MPCFSFFQAELIADLIQASETHMTDAHMNEGALGSDDVHYFLDIDMAILGSDVTGKGFFIA